MTRLAERATTTAAAAAATASAPTIDSAATAAFARRQLVASVDRGTDGAASTGRVGEAHGGGAAGGPW